MLLLCSGGKVFQKWQPHQEINVTWKNHNIQCVFTEYYHNHVKKKTMNRKTEVDYGQVILIDASR